MFNSHYAEQRNAEHREATRNVDCRDCGANSGEQCTWSDGTQTDATHAWRSTDGAKSLLGWGH